MVAAPGPQAPPLWGGAVLTSGSLHSVSRWGTACRRACCVACGAGQRCRVAAPVLASRAGRVDAERAWEGSRAPDCGAGWHHTPRDARRLAYGGVQLDQRLTSQQINFLIWLLQRVLGYQLGIEIFLSFLF